MTMKDLQQHVNICGHTNVYSMRYQNMEVGAVTAHSNLT